MSHTPTWKTERAPEFENMSTIPIPSDDVVRDVAQAARSLDVEDSRVEVNTRGLVPPSIVLDQLLFDVDPNPRPEIVGGEIVFTVTEPLDVEGYERDGFIRVKVEADVDTHRIESVDVSAGV